MAEDATGAPLSRRVPGTARLGPVQPVKPVLSESVLNRMQAAIDAEQGREEPRRQDDPNTEPLPRVTLAGAPSKRGPGRPPSPSGAAPETGPLPDQAAQPEVVARPPRAAGLAHATTPLPPADPPRLAESPRPAESLRPAEPPTPEPPTPELPLRVAKALGAAAPHLLRAAELSLAEPPPAVSEHPAEPHYPPQSPQAAEPPRTTWGAEFEPGRRPGSIGWLWPDETTAPRGGGPRWRPPGRWRYRTAALVAGVVVVVAGAGLGIGMLLHSTPVAAAHGNSTPKATARPTPSAAPTPTSAPSSTVDPAVLADAVAWITQQVAPATVIACDVQTCAALTASGYPADQEVQLGSYSPTLSNASIVVVTPTLRSYFSTVNPSLGNYVAPAVLASFGPVNIQPIAPAGAAAYANALNQDVQARMQLGEHLLNSGLVSASPAAQNDLATGQVDPRVLLALQAIINQQLAIDVLGFSDSGPGASPGVPFREVTLNGNAQASGLPTKVYLNSLSAVLNAHATFPQFTKAQGVTLSPGVNGVRIEWAAPSPFASALSASG